MTTVVRGGTLERTDQGVDIGVTPGRPILDPVPGVSKLVGVISDWYRGQPLYDWQVQNGPFKGAFWYIAEQIRSPRRVASQGQQIGTTAQSGTGLELGYAANASGQTLAQATTGYTEGQVTPAGLKFRRQIINSRGRARGVTKTNSLNVPGYVPKAYVGWVRSAAQGTGLPASVVAAQIDDESAFNPGATSSAGAEGIAQFLPSTFRSYGKGSPYNAADSQQAYVNYMNSLLRQFHGNVRNALAAYNAGPGNLQAGYGYADSILSKAGVNATATAASAKPRYGGTRPGGQPVNQSGQDVNALFASYEQEINAPRVAPPGTKNPFQWWWMSFTGIWNQEISGASAAGQGAAQGISQVAQNG